MSADEKPEPEVILPEPWDGKPIISLNYAEYTALVYYVPHYHGVVRGPDVPFSGGGRATLAVNNILCNSREEAEAILHDWAHRAAVAEGLDYNSDEWSIDHLVLLNGN